MAASAKVVRSLRYLVIADVIVSSPGPTIPSVDDEAEIAGMAGAGFDAGGNAINPVDARQQRRLGIVGRRKAVIGTRQVLLRDRADDIRRHQHHQLGLVVDEILAAEEAAENGELIEAGQAVDRLLGLLLD